MSIKELQQIGFRAKDSGTGLAEIEIDGIGVNSYNMELIISRRRIIFRDKVYGLYIRRRLL